MKSLSLRTKVHGILIFAVTILSIVTEVAFIFFVAGEMKNDEKTFIANASQNASVLADTVVAPFIDKDFVVLNNLAARYEKYPFCAYVTIVDTDQRIMTRSGRLDLGDRFNIPVAFETSIHGSVSVSKYFKDGKEYVDFSCPIKAGDLVLGAVRMGFTAEFRQEAATSLKKSILVSGLATIGVIILGFFLASWVVDKTIVPLLQLKNAADKIGSGDYDQIVRITSNDEVGLLSRSFNEMARELKASRAHLVEKKYLDSIISNMQEALFVLTPDGSIQTVNAGALELTGYDQSEVINRPFESMFGELEDGAAFLSELRDRSIITHVEAVIRSKTGKIIPVLVSGSIMAQGSGIVGMVIVATDITEQQEARDELQIHRERLQQLVDERTAQLMQTNQKLKEQIVQRERMEEELVKAQKLESVAILAGGIAHDFNNLLTTILSNISMAMLDISRRHEANDSLRRAEQATLRAADLTQQLLTFSKGGAPIKRIASIGAIVRESSEFALQGSRVRCNISVLEDLWLAEVDPGQISQVMHNLVINAVQAMPQGGTMEIRCENVVLPGFGASDRGGRFVKIVVRDKGVGIAREHLSKIFDPYFTTKQRGSGLGLATAYSIIKKHGGSITVESELGTGTAFTIFVPASDTTAEVLQTEDGQLQTGQGKILIMDDDDELRVACSKALTTLGYSIVPASDGMQAIELFGKAMQSGAPFDAVILDLTVRGGMGGKETIKRLLEIMPDLKAIVSSGYSNDPVMSDYRRHGFNAVLVKPYRVEDLSEIVRLVLAENQPRM